MSWIKRIAVLTGALAVAASVLVGIGAATSKAAPSNTSLPSISGSAKDGSLLTASHGCWTSSPTSYAYAWERCDNSGGSCAAIGGATSSQYTATSADVNHKLRVVVTATNSSGSGTATSRATDSRRGDRCGTEEHLRSRALEAPRRKVRRAHDRQGRLERDEPDHVRLPVAAL